MHVDLVDIGSADRLRAPQPVGGPLLGAQCLQHRKGLCGKSFVNVDVIDVIEIESRLLERTGHRDRRSDEHLVRRIHADVAPGAEGRQRPQAERPGFLLTHEQDRRGTIGERTGVTRGHCAVVIEDGLERGQLFHAGVLTDQAVAGHARDGNDLPVESSRRDGRGRTAVRADRELVLGLAGDAVNLGHFVGRFPHHLTRGALLDLGPAWQQSGERGQAPCGVEVILRLGLTQGQRGGRVNQLLRQVDSRVRGGVGATGDHHVVFAALDRGGRGGDGLQTGSARARDGVAFDAVPKLEIECDLAGDVRRARRQDHPTPDDRLDLTGRDLGVVQQAAHRLVGQRNGVHAGELTEGTNKWGACARDNDSAALGRSGHGGELTRESVARLRGCGVRKAQHPLPVQPPRKTLWATAEPVALTHPTTTASTPCRSWHTARRPAGPLIARRRRPPAPGPMRRPREYRRIRRGFRCETHW
ncbi:Uncharacterised protein [Mycobacteroides abscessus subsp. massiliense]|nr:Uncharacterised protein [Mycobacteroides abscessus subsp. massiliense]